MTAPSIRYSTIYSITNLKNNQRYIGQTVELKRRKREHFRALKRGDHPNKHLQQSFNKYGSKQFKFEILEHNIPLDEINERERYWIKYYDSYHNGYNLTLGGKAEFGIGKECQWNGKTYQSIKEAVNESQWSYSTVTTGMRRGLSCDKDLIPVPVIKPLPDLLAAQKRRISEWIEQTFKHSPMVAVLYTTDRHSLGLTIRRRIERDEILKRLLLNDAVNMDDIDWADMGGLVFRMMEFEHINWADFYKKEIEWERSLSQRQQEADE